MSEIFAITRTNIYIYIYIYIYIFIYTRLITRVNGISSIYLGIYNDKQFVTS